MAEAAVCPVASLVAERLANGFPRTRSSQLCAPRPLATHTKGELSTRKAAEGRRVTDAAATKGSILRRVPDAQTTEEEEKALEQEAAKVVAQG